MNENVNFPIIDCHCHIYPQAITGKAVEAIEGFYDNRYKGFDGTVATMLKNAEAAGVVHHIVFSVATTPHQVNSINRFISDCVKNSNGIFTGLGTLHPDSVNQEKDFENLLSLGLKGVKLHPDFQKIPLDDERCMEIYKLCSKRLPVLLHTGDYRFDYSNPDRMKRVLEKFPECTFIGAHFGGWSVWDKAVEELSSYENFYVDTSSSLSDISTETAARLIEAYTPDRVLFGTDYPLGDSRKEVVLLKKAVACSESRKKIFQVNAEKLFNIRL